MSDESQDGQPVDPVEPAVPEPVQDAPVVFDDQAGDPFAAAEAAIDAEPASETMTIEEAPPPEPKDPGVLKEVLEALIFVHRGILPPKTVREVLGEEYTAEEIAAGFAALREDYAARGGALVLAEVAGGYQFATRADLAPWIKKLDFYEHHRHLSRPTMETLAIIAYKQPVTRAEIEAIRGVNVERIVRNLLERKLVRILGHKDVPGKPMVVGTTKEFLELFGLNSLAGLPPLKDFVEPPSSEGIDEELPLPFPLEETAQGGGNVDETAAPVPGVMEQETEHGPASQTGIGERETDEDHETPHDGDPETDQGHENRPDGVDPAAGTGEAD